MRGGPARAYAACVLVALCAACVDEVELPSYTGPGLRYPVTMVVDPSQRWLYVVGANFDRAHHGGVVAVLDTVAGSYVPGGRVEVPSYAAAARFDGDRGSDGTLRPLLWVAARDDDSLTAIEVAADAAGGPPTLSCGRADATLGTCAGSHRVGGEASGDLDIGTDPLALALDRDGAGARMLHVAATGDGAITPLRVKRRANGGVTATKLPGLSLGAGLADIAVGPASGRVYVADSRANRLHAYAPAEDDALAPATFAGVGLPRAASSEFGRGMALSSDGARLYLAYRSPNALAIIDIALQQGGAPRDALVDLVGLGGRPAQVAVARTGPQGADLVYVSCFGTDDIWVVDPTLRRVVDVIRLSHSPYALAVADVPGRGPTLYVALFSRHQVVAVPIAPGATDRHKVTEVVQ